jgi:hypothetical protein
MITKMISNLQHVHSTGGRIGATDDHAKPEESDETTSGLIIPKLEKSDADMSELNFVKFEGSDEASSVPNFSLLGEMRRSGDALEGSHYAIFYEELLQEQQEYVAECMSDRCSKNWRPHIETLRQYLLEPRQPPDTIRLRVTCPCGNMIWDDFPAS